MPPRDPRTCCRAIMWLITWLIISASVVKLRRQRRQRPFVGTRGPACAIPRLHLQIVEKVAYLPHENQ